MKRWYLDGGQPLHGKIKVAGAKNVVVKLMIAALLSSEASTLLNVPDIGDVEIAIQMINRLGGRVEYLAPDSIRIIPNNWSNFSIPSDLGKKSRVSSIFTAPLLARWGEAQLPIPGGDQIGRRPLNWHFEGLNKLGVKIDQKNETIHFRTTGLTGSTYRFPKNTHTGTETLILTAVLAKGQTILENAAEEPEVDDLIMMLNQMGANVKRIKPRIIQIDGVERLHGTTYKVMADRNEEVSLSCMALASKGDLWIEDAQPQHLKAFLNCLKKMGAGYKVEKSSLHVWYKGPLKPIFIETSPHPGFMSDWHPLLTTLLTQAQGKSIIHEKVFDSRFAYVNELREMGAKIVLFNPKVSNPKKVYNFNWVDDDLNKHAAKIYGPTQLKGIHVQVSDVRAGATLVQAALMAKGQTSIFGVEHIERGYENLVERLKLLGANIKSID